MNSRIINTILFVATAIIFLSTAYAQISGKTKTDTIQASPVTLSAINQLKPQTTCPVMGTEINRKLYVDYNGKRIYVCCTDCIDQVAKDPEMYIKKLKSIGQSVETIGNETIKAGKEAPAGTSVKKTGTDKIGDSTAATTDAGYWTCTMNPGIRKTESGTCPICGMKLIFRKNNKDTVTMTNVVHPDVKK